eukprot:gene9722-20216_t
MSKIEEAISYSNKYKDFPKHGITFEGVEDFIIACGGKEILLGKSTTEVCENYLKPMTKSSEKSYCDHLLLQGKGTHLHIKSANIFVSHAWKYEFLSVIDALKTILQPEDNSVIWFDLFTNCQHGLQQPPPFEWWCETFMTAIQDIGRTVMVMAPWSDPITLTRSWCLWEIYCTAKTNSKFDIAMSSIQQKNFESAICNDPSVFYDMLGDIDVRRSEAWNRQDKDQINDAIKRTIGHDILNKNVFTCIRSWTLTILQRNLDEKRALYGETHLITLKAMRGLVLLYVYQGNFDEANSLCEKCYQTYEQILPQQQQPNTTTTTSINPIETDPNTHQDTVKDTSKDIEIGSYEEEKLMTQYAMGVVAAARGETVRAEHHYKECLHKRTALLGETHVDTLKTMNGLASLYITMGVYDMAEPLYETCYNRQKSSLGEEHADTLRTMRNLGELYQLQGKSQLSRKFYENTYQKMCVVLGKEHPSTTSVESKLADIYVTDNEKDLALKLYINCLELRTIKLGEDHPDTLVSMSKLAIFYDNEKNFMEAEILTTKCYEIRKRILGVEHQDTISSLNNLAILYSHMNNKELARSSYEKCYEIMKRIAGTDHPNTLKAMMNLANAYVNTENNNMKNDDKVQAGVEVEVEVDVNAPDVVVAGRLFKDCYELRKSKLGVLHTEAISAVRAYGKYLQIVGKYEDAASLYRTTFQSLKEEILRRNKLNLSNDEKELVQLEGKLALRNIQLMIGELACHTVNIDMIPQSIMNTAMYTYAILESYEESMKIHERVIMTENDEIEILAQDMNILDRENTLKKVEMELQTLEKHFPHKMHMYAAETINHYPEGYWSDPKNRDEKILKLTFIEGLQKELNRQWIKTGVPTEEELRTHGESLDQFESKLKNEEILLTNRQIALDLKEQEVSRMKVEFTVLEGTVAEKSKQILNEAMEVKRSEYNLGVRMLSQGRRILALKKAQMERLRLRRLSEGVKEEYMCLETLLPINEDITAAIRYNEISELHCTSTPMEYESMTALIDEGTRDGSVLRYKETESMALMASNADPGTGSGTTRNSKEGHDMTWIDSVDIEALETEMKAKGRKRIEDDLEEAKNRCTRAATALTQAKRAVELVVQRTSLGTRRHQLDDVELDLKEREASLRAKTSAMQSKLDMLDSIGFECSQRKRELQEIENTFNAVEKQLQTFLSSRRTAMEQKLNRTTTDETSPEVEVEVEDFPITGSLADYGNIIDDMDM